MTQIFIRRRFGVNFLVRQGFQRCVNYKRISRRVCEWCQSQQHSHLIKASGAWVLHKTFHITASQSPIINRNTIIKLIFNSSLMCRSAVVFLCWHLPSHEYVIFIANATRLIHFNRIIASATHGFDDVGVCRWQNGNLKRKFYIAVQSSIRCLSLSSISWAFGVKLWTLITFVSDENHVGVLNGTKR